MSNASLAAASRWFCQKVRKGVLELCEAAAAVINDLP